MSARLRLRVPAEDGAILAQPPLADVGRLLDANRRRLQASIDLLGQPLANLQKQARQEAVAAAGDYLRQAGEPVSSADSTRLLLAGHQPELCHPGVWVKHFALAGLARRHGLTPLHLIVDHDTVKSTSLRLPAKKGNEIYLATVPFDDWTGEIPYEERAVQDEGLFASFADRAGQTLAEWGIESLLPEFWSTALASRGRLGERFTSARRNLERRWGCHNLELPTSRLCRTEAFAWFAAHLVLNIDRFIDIHNDALAEYRRINRVRSKNHPVSDLIHDGDWRELPFWGWRQGQARRGRLMARMNKDRIELRAGDDVWPALPARPADLVAAWKELEPSGHKVRCRALTTTLYARLLLGDLFLHGIGGGKYDELTDAIIQRCYAIEPPAYLVLSATLHLPLPAPAARADRAGLIRLVRDLHYNPQRHLRDANLPELARQKQAWIERQPADQAGRRQRFQAIRDLTGQLRALVADDEAAARHRLAEQEALLRDLAILRRRDYAFCLFPEAKLRPLMTSFLEG